MAKNPSPQAQAAAILAGQYAPLNITANRQRQLNLAERQAAQRATLALVKQLQAGVLPAGQVYDTAAAQQQALAQAGAAGLAKANPDAQVQADLAAVNAPQSQRAALAAQMGQQFGGQGAVLNVLQGAVPGASLAAQKAATQQFMAGLPTVAGLAGQRAQTTLQQEALDNAAQLAVERAKVAAQLPGLTMDIANRQQDVGFRERQFAAQQAADAADRALRQQEFAAGQQLTPYQAAELALQQQSAAQGKTYAPQIIGSSGAGYYQYDPNTGKVARVIAPVKSSSSSSSTGTGGMTQTQVRAVRAKGNQLIAHVREARTLAKAGKPYPSGPNKGEPIVAPTYNQAVQAAEQQGIPLDIIVPMLNKIFPAQYEVTNRGLKQIGIRGYPSTFTKSGARKKRRRR